MKLWWPHNEAMISFLMAYKKSKNPQYLDRFGEVFEYSYKHVSILPRFPRQTHACSATNHIIHKYDNTITDIRSNEYLYEEYSAKRSIFLLFVT